MADVLDLPGRVSQGKTLQEAIENVKDAISGYMEVEKEKAESDRFVFIHEESFIGELIVGQVS